MQLFDSFREKLYACCHVGIFYLFKINRIVFEPHGPVHLTQCPSYQAQLQLVVSRRHVFQGAQSSFASVLNEERILVALITITSFESASSSDYDVVP